MPSVSLELLKTRSSADRIALDLASENLTLASVDGHTQKDVYVKRLSNSGSLTGVMLSDVIRRFDPLLQKECYTENSTLSFYQTTDKVLQQINFLFGSKGNDFSFAADISNLSKAFFEAGNSADPYQKTVVVNSALDLTKNLTNFAERLQDMKSQTDLAISDAVKAVNQHLQEIANLNAAIVNTINAGQDASGLQDQRDQEIHNLSAYVDINAYLNPNNNTMMVGLQSGNTILNGQIVVGQGVQLPVQFSFVPSIIATPTTPMNPVMLGSMDVTQKIGGGILGGLINLRDTVIPNLQAELDELTRNVRDQINAIHNQGTSSTGQSTLTGTAGIPGSGAPLTGAEVISGTGTIRLATLSQGGIVDYKDIALTDGMTVNGLITSINAGAYGLNNAQGAFTASLTAQGQLQISSTNGYGVALGSANNSAQLSFTATYDPTQSYGFSHFFGMNNFFNTGNSMASSTPQVGITNNLSVNNVYVANPNFVCNGHLSTNTPAETTPEGALGGQDLSVLRSIAQSMRTGTFNFNAVGVIPQLQTNLLSYASQIISVTENQIQTNTTELDAHKIFYENIAKRNNDYSASNPEAVLMDIVSLSSSQLLVTKAMSIVIGMEQKISDILSR